jgi:hypothetical protein
MRKYPDAISKLFEIDNQNYEALISALKTNAQIKKKEFLEIDYTELRKASLPLFIEKMAKYYQALVFFPDDEILNRFAHYQIDTGFHKWFTSIDLLSKEFDSINSGDKPGIFKFYSLEYIKSHFEVQIFIELIRWGGYITKPTPTKKELNNIYKAYKRNLRNIKYAESVNQVGKMKYPESLTYSLINDLTPVIGSKEESIKFFNIIFKGKSELIHISTLVEFYIKFERETYITSKPQSDRLMLSNVYNLCKLVLKNPKLLMESQFFEPEEITYDNNFVKFQSKNLITLLHLKKIKF